jgi:hypothetical protein
MVAQSLRGSIALNGRFARIAPLLAVALAVVACDKRRGSAGPDFDADTDTDTDSDIDTDTDTDTDTGAHRVERGADKHVGAAVAVHVAATRDAEARAVVSLCSRELAVGE